MAPGTILSEDDMAKKLAAQYPAVDLNLDALATQADRIVFGAGRRAEAIGRRPGRSPHSRPDPTRPENG